MSAIPELDEEEFLEPRTLLRQTIAADRFPLPPRIRKLQAILDKLVPPAARPPPFPAPKPAGLLLTRKKRGRR